MSDMLTWFTDTQSLFVSFQGDVGGVLSKISLSEPGEFRLTLETFILLLMLVVFFKLCLNSIASLPRFLLDFSVIIMDLFMQT